jgi:hypothetical protein
VVKHGSALELLFSLSGIGPFYRKVTIGTLPDDVLLEIFDFYADRDRIWSIRDDWWHTLVHVCRRWRNVVFASPRRLRLQLLCRPNRSVKEMSDIWPELPIVISDEGWYDRRKTVENVKNAIDALELNDRVSGIDLRVSCSDMERFAAVMQHPFPALTDLDIWLYDEMAPVISDSFLGGSAPNLQRLELEGIPFPALPRLLLSATDLVKLQLLDIPHSGYFSPEAMVTGLSALTRLESLTLGFRSPRSRPAKASRRPPHLTRTVFPALIRLDFRGVTEYLEDLVARIDTPLLVGFSIRFFNQLVFDLLQLTKFLCRRETFTVLNQAQVDFEEHITNVEFSSRTETFKETSLTLTISCRELDWQLSSLSQVCNSILLALSTMDMEYPDLDLHIYGAYPLLIEDDMEDTQWLELLHPFTNVKDLCLFREVATCIAPALQEVAGERVTEILPTLQNIFLDGFYGEHVHVPKAISEFVAARQLSGCPVAIHRRRWDSKSGTWVVIESSTQ